jgi:glycosyltransferase involved in cell wall biosynthesis
MSIVALTHGYPPIWNMGGEVSLHRSLTPLNGTKIVLTKTDEDYEFEGIQVKKIHAQNVLNINTDHIPIAKQLAKLNARVAIGQNELSLATVLAAKEIGAISIVNIHTPPKYGARIKKAVILADYAVYNTEASAKEWGEPNAFVLHPPINILPKKKKPTGEAYTILSSLVNKGIEVVLELAKMYPDKKFIIVRSPAEPTHGLPDLEQRVKKLPNVKLYPRVAPEEVYKYLEETRILLVPSRYETYGMSAIEAAQYGIPAIHVDTPHVREGIGEAAILIPPLDVAAAAKGIEAIEKDYDKFSKKALARAAWLQKRQEKEISQFVEFIDKIKKPENNGRRKAQIVSATKRYK